MRLIAENGIRDLWRRDGADAHQKRLDVLMRELDTRGTRARELRVRDPSLVDVYETILTREPAP